MKLTLVRHGRPDEGQAQRVNAPSLNALGRRAADAVARLLADEGVTRIDAGPLQRAQGDAEWPRFLDEPARYRGGHPTAFRSAVLQALQASTDAPDDAHVAVFTHGLPINTVLSHPLGLERIVHFRPGYGSITRLLARGGRFSVASVNESAHHRLPCS